MERQGKIMKTLIKLSLLFLTIILNGCGGTMQKVMQTADYSKTLGTNSPDFFIGIEKIDISISTGGKVMGKSIKFDDSVAIKKTCEAINNDKTLDAMIEYELIEVRPRCTSTNGENEYDIKMALKDASQDCFWCNKNTLFYLDKKGEILNQFTVSNLMPHEIWDFYTGHIKNMLLASIINQAKTDPVYKKNFISFCKSNEEAICG